MARFVGPKLGKENLSPAAIVNLLRGEFEFVDADQAAGANHVGDMIAHLMRIKEGYDRWKDPPPDAAQINVNIAKLEAARDGAINVTLSDDPSSEFRYVSFTIIPGEPLFLGYCCQHHEDEAVPLLQRLAFALGYESSIN